MRSQVDRFLFSLLLTISAAASVVRADEANYRVIRINPGSAGLPKDTPVGDFAPPPKQDFRQQTHPADVVRGSLTDKNRDVGLNLTASEQKSALEHNNLGVQLGSKGDWEPAFKEHEAALLENPTNITFRRNLSSAHLQYGKTLRNKNDYKGAMVEFRKAIFIDPEDKSAIDEFNKCREKLDDKSGENPAK